MINDIFKELWAILRPDATAETKTAAYDKISPKLKSLNDFVGEKPFALGYVTLADFNLSERLYYLENAFPDLKKNYPSLFRVRHNFEQLPEIKDYYSRPDAVL